MHKQRIDVHIEKNALVDNGDGVISFPGGQCIVDDSEMWNGLKYDINSLDISQYKDTLTCDHIDSLQTLIGKVDGTAKQDNKVTINSIRFAVQESAAGKLAYDLMRGGFLNSFSVETAGPWPGEEDRTYRNHALVGLSTVVTGNNKSASINELVKNSIAQSKKAGLDTTKLEQALNLEEEPPVENGQKSEEPEQPEGKPKNEQQINQEPDMKFAPVKNKRDFAIEVAYKNSAGEDSRIELQPNASIDVSEDQILAIETQINSAQKPVDVDTLVKNAVAEANKTSQEEFNKTLDELKTYREAFDKAAQEPEFRKPADHEVRATNGATSKLASLDWKERVALLARNSLVAGKNLQAAQTVMAINGLHLEELQKAGLVENSLDLTGIGNFVLPPELITDIKGNLTDYTELLKTFKFEETLSMVTSWLSRTGDISMVDVDINATGSDIKSIKNPSYTTNTANLREFAAVTPIKKAALRFSAADLVSEITKLYSHAYDRYLSSSIIGRLALAVQSNGNSVQYDFSAGTGGGKSGALVSLITAWADVAEFTPNGVYIMTRKSYLHLLAMALQAGTNGPLADIFTKGPDDVPMFLNRPYVVVPSDVMPSLNTASTVSLTFEGTSATNGFGVLYADPTNFMGRVSGGLNFDMSEEAAYEEGGVTKSAFQRDEVLFRGYGFIKSAITLPINVAGILAPGIS